METAILLEFDFPFDFLMHWNPSVYVDVHTDFFSFNSESNAVKKGPSQNFLCAKDFVKVTQIHFLFYRDYAQTQYVLYFWGLFTRLLAS